jgi:hypothetical protein
MEEQAAVEQLELWLPAPPFLLPSGGSRGSSLASLGAPPGPPSSAAATPSPTAAAAATADLSAAEAAKKGPDAAATGKPLPAAPLLASHLDCGHLVTLMPEPRPSAGGGLERGRLSVFCGWGSTKAGGWLP